MAGNLFIDISDNSIGAIKVAICQVKFSLNMGKLATENSQLRLISYIVRSKLSGSMGIEDTISQLPNIGRNFVNMVNSIGIELTI
jgi:hypothetical protein